MIDTLKQWDTALFLFLNGMHHDFFDVLMFWMSKGWFWTPVYLLLLYLLIRKYKYNTFYLLIAYALLITLTDQLSLHLFKNTFQRLRPSHEPDLQGLVHTYQGYLGGKYGFVSSHAANFAGLVTLSILLLKNTVKYLAFYLICWAVLICYTRIYLGVHYPGDIICGAILGVLVGVGIFKLYSAFFNKPV